MILETVEARGLAHLSYLVGDERAGACAVVDPRRDISVYLEIARRHNVRITHILETHIHADFVSGSRELAAQTGAPICVGAADEYGFEHQPLQDGDTLEVGSLRLTALHTPGHTPEHVCFLIQGGKGAQEPWGLFSGDLLFAGEVGRPDLLGGGTEERLARDLYRTFHEKILPLPDGISVYPAHGEGSPCGGSIGDRRTTTIGYERQFNYKLGLMSEDDFVRLVLSDLPPAPFYYPRMKRINAEGPPVVGCIPNPALLAADAFQEAMAQENAIVVDAREIEAFGGAHIEGAQNIALRDEFPIWAGWMLQPDQRILLAPQRTEDIEAIQRHLLRIGLDNLAGVLRRGMRGWIESGQRFTQLAQMSVHALKARVDAGAKDLQILDVRRADEWRGGHIPGAQNIFVPFLPENLDKLDPDRPLVVYCGGGYRASVAASLLQRHGFTKIHTVPGGMAAWTALNYPTVIPA